MEGWVHPCTRILKVSRVGAVMTQDTSLVREGESRVTSDICFSIPNP